MSAMTTGPASRAPFGVLKSVALMRNIPPVVMMAATHISGFIRIEADDLEHATRLLAGIPVYEAGGTVEIRELPRDD